MKTGNIARKTVSVLASLALLSTMVVAVPMESFAAEEVTTISSAADWNDFADDVNGDNDYGGNDYSGKTVTLTVDLSGTSLKPVGTTEHPFNGTFEGGGHALNGLNLNGMTYVGLFGVVGKGGVIQNLEIESGSITIEDATEVVEYVGSLVGFCEGSLLNCTSSAEISITSKLKGTDVDETNNGLTIEEIGGLAGVVYGDMTGCSFTGSLTVHTDEVPGSDGSIAQNIAGLAGLFGGYIEENDDSSACIAHYGGVEDVTADTPISLASDCKNSGDISVEATNQSGVDRFGETTTTKCLNIGGIAGYSLGNVTNCDNTGTVSSWNGLSDGDSWYDSTKPQRIGCGDAVGGICGNMRAEVITSPTYTGEDPGMSDQRELTFAECQNEGEVVGLHATGGLLGVAGTYTVVKACKNSGDISGTRWNKPAPAGIAGQAYGTVCYCYNTGDVMTETGGGYFAAGIVGTLNIFSDSATGSRTSPVSEVYACYNVGSILANGSYRSGTIVGENNGYIRNSYSMTSCNTSNGNALIGENNATYDTDSCRSVAQANFRYKFRPVTGKVDNTCPVPYMNMCAPADDWEYYYVIDADEDVTYPELNIWTTTSTTSIDGLQATFSEDDVTDASFTAGRTPIPGLAKCNVTIDGEETALYQYCDFKVIPQEDARDADTDYAATIEGIGCYSGKPSLKFTYHVIKGDLAECTVTVDSVTFNWEDQNPQTNPKADPLKITVKDPTGEVLEEDGNYDFYVNPEGIGVTPYPEGYDSDDYAEDDGDESGGTDDSDPSVLVPGNLQITVDGETYDLQKYKESKDEESKAEGGAGCTYADILGGTQQECVNADEAWETNDAYEPYYVVVVDEEAESSYAGLNYSVFVVKFANLVTGMSSDEETAKWQMGDFEYNGKAWQWDPKEWDFYTTNNAGEKEYGMSFPYEAKSIEPELVANDTGVTLRYLDTELEYGKDYTIVYGDPGRDDLIDQDTDEPNFYATTVEGNPRACMTLRYVPGGNFTNYINMYFTIDTVSLTDDCVITAPEQTTYDYTGSEIEPDFEVSLGDVTLRDGIDYDITYTNNVSAGTATATITGVNSVVGTYTWDFEIVASEQPGTPKPNNPEGSQPKAGSVVTVTSGPNAGMYRITGSDTAELIRNLTKSASLNINTAKIDGKNYKVTSIGSAALKGDKNLKKVTLGNNVKKIGAKAFMKASKLKKVTIGKKLKSIGKKAFFNCKQLKSVKIKSTKLKKVGAKAFAKTPKLSKTLVPKNKVSKYKKLLKKGGLKKQVSKL